MDDQFRRKEFDAIVVGAGAGGATVARELTRRGRRVLVLERGANIFLRDSMATMLRVLRAVPVGGGMTTLTAQTTGGSTGVYAAIAEMPHLDYFQSLGMDLSKELEQVRTELPIATLPDELMGPQTLRVRESAIECGHDWKKRLMIIDQPKCRAGYSYEAKWNARVFLQSVGANGGTILPRATVLKVIVEGNKAVGVEYTLGRANDGRDIHRAYGAKIVLSAGSVATPILLRNSGIKNIGDRGFYCDPCLTVFATVHGLKGTDCFTGTMGTEYVDDVSCGDANFSRPLYRLFMLGNRRFRRLLAHSRTLGVGVVTKDDFGGRLREDGRCDKSLTDADRQRLNKGEALAAKILRKAGGTDLFTSGLGAACVGGLIRMQTHFDKSFETEYRNLHVCDASVIPQHIRSAPTITLICLAKYLATKLSSFAQDDNRTEKSVAMR
jgi:hypothetical protein